VPVPLAPVAPRTGVSVLLVRLCGTSVIRVRSHPIEVGIVLSLAPCVDDDASVAVGPDPLVHVRTPWDRRLNGSWRGRGVRALLSRLPL
jgi:hypothetical protein